MATIGTQNRAPKHDKRQSRRDRLIRAWNCVVLWTETGLRWALWALKTARVFCRRLMRRVAQMQPTVRALCIAVACVAVLGGLLSIRPALRLLTAKKVTFSDDGLSVTVRTHSGTVADLLMEYNIVLGEGDVVYPELADPVKGGGEVLVRRAVSVSVSADGQTRRVSLLNGTVGKALYLAGVSVDADDIVTPALTESVTSGMEITVNRVDITTEVEQRRLKYRITYQDDDDLYIGTEEMVKQGSEGVKEVTLRVVTVDGVETERTVVSEEVIEPAQNRIVAQGTKPTPTPTPKPTPKPTATPRKSASPTKTAAKTASPTKTSTPKSTPDPNKKQASDVTDSTITVDGKTYTYSKTLTVMITAYTHTGRKTSTGVWPKIGTVAVDKSVIPYGTKMYIPGYGFGVAQDTGVSGNHIDVFFDTEAECIQFGRKRDRTIYILSD